jgi:hypothetical protein
LKNVQPISQPLVQHGAAPETPRPTKALRQRSRPGAGAQGRDFHHIHQILINDPERREKKKKKHGKVVMKSEYYQRICGDKFDLHRLTTFWDDNRLEFTHVSQGRVHHQ